MRVERRPVVTFQDKSITIDVDIEEMNDLCETVFQWMKDRGVEHTMDAAGLTAVLFETVLRSLRAGPMEKFLRDHLSRAADLLCEMQRLSEQDDVDGAA